MNKQKQVYVMRSPLCVAYVISDNKREACYRFSQSVGCLVPTQFVRHIGYSTKAIEVAHKEVGDRFGVVYSKR